MYEILLQSNAVSHWLGVNLESAGLRVSCFDKFIHVVFQVNSLFNTYRKWYALFIENTVLRMEMSIT